MKARTILICLGITLCVPVMLLHAESTPEQQEILMRDAYKAEQGRFQQVLKSTSDKERFIVLKYAIAHRFVPNRQMDPFFNMHVMVGVWQRSLMVYGSLKNRKDLLRKIYPNLEILDEYVHWGSRTGAPYKDTTITNTIMRNVGQIAYLDSLMGNYRDTTSLDYRFYATPRMKRVN